ncbi:hypothetical protein VB773_21020 [Haloarculaceae archaeon H-GB2-1]|nr:hypothetical protein [Haloarculaceae archaeon H-GB11]MEA5409804.1 hypothetical protein [Haloarculaceae archaeon H-GB2-1]
MLLVKIFCARRESEAQSDHREVHYLWPDGHLVEELLHGRLAGLAEAIAPDGGRTGDVRDRLVVDENAQSKGDLEPRTKRAVAEPMDVSLLSKGGRDEVQSASGNRYEVDVIDESCTCPDWQQRSRGVRSVTRHPAPRLARRIPGAKTSGSPTRSASTAQSRRNRIPTSAITTPATAVGSSSTPSRGRRRVAPAASGTSSPAQLTRFRIELGHLDGPLQLCECCSPGGLATYWTHDLEAHVVEQ